MNLPHAHGDLKPSTVAEVKETQTSATKEISKSGCPANTAAETSHAEFTRHVDVYEAGVMKTEQRCVASFWAAVKSERKRTAVRWPTNKLERATQRR